MKKQDIYDKLRLGDVVTPRRHGSHLAAHSCDGAAISLPAKTRTGALALALSFTLVACSQGYGVEDTSDAVVETPVAGTADEETALPAPTDSQREAAYWRASRGDELAAGSVDPNGVGLAAETPQPPAAQGTSSLAAPIAAGYTVAIVDNTTDEAGATGSFKVRLNAQPTAAVTLKFQVNDTGEAQLPVSQVTFTTANWATDQTVIVTGRNDTFVDGSQSYAVLFLDSDSTDTRYDRRTANIVPLPLTFVNADDEFGIVGLPSKGNPGEWGSRVPVSFKLSRRPSMPVTVSLVSSNPAEGVLSTSSLSWQTSEWDITRTAYVIGVDDEVADTDPSYNITATAASSDSNFNGRTRSVSYQTFDDDWEMRATSYAENPFTCSTFSDVGVPWTQLTFPAYPTQNPQFKQTGNDNSYIDLRVLAVNVRSTYTRSWTNEQIAAELVAQQHAMNMVVHASYGLVNVVRTELTLEKHWDSTNFKTGNELSPTCWNDCANADEVDECRAACGHYRFVSLDALGTEINRFQNTNNFDVIQINFPYADSVVDGNIAAGYAWARNVNNTPAKWYDGRSTFWQRQPGASIRPNVYLHELVHLTAWGMQRAGRPGLNPHSAFWKAFPIRTIGESPHWDDFPGTGTQAELRASFWTQLYHWTRLPSMATVPLGVLRTRAGTHNILSERISATEFRQRRVRR